MGLNPQTLGKNPRMYGEKSPDSGEKSPRVWGKCFRRAKIDFVTCGN